MICVKATVRGEPDVPPFTRVFNYDEHVFFTSAAVIEEKIRRSMKINANEALVAYCSYVVKSIHAGKQNIDIQKGAPKVLSANNVMIGVPETLQTITFETTLDNRVRRVTIKDPIPASSYIMAER